MIDLTKIEDDTVFALTEKGLRQLTEPGTRLPAQDLEVLVLIDGKLTVCQVGSYLPRCAQPQLPATLRQLVQGSYLRVATASDGCDFDPGSFFDTLTVVDTFSKSSDRNHRAAIVGSQFLEKNGYFVNMARPMAINQKSSPSKRTKILAIDDDIEICNLLKLYLSLEAMEVRAATNRIEVLEQFRLGGIPDLILLDVMMPEINGFDLLGRIRSQSVLKNVPVVMLTAESSRGGVLRGIAGGANGYVTKPFRVQPLVRSIKSILSIEIEPSEILWDTL